MTRTLATLTATSLLVAAPLARSGKASALPPSSRAPRRPPSQTTGSTWPPKGDANVSSKWAVHNRSSPSL